MITISKKQTIFAMSANNAAVMTINSGEKVSFETCDCFTDQITSQETPFNELDWNRINPATGPVFINGAEPGDILKVEINNIALQRDYAVMVTAPGLGVIGDKLTQAEIHIVPIKKQHAILPGNISIPINPMIGVIGVAPKDQDISCGTPDKHGGNMDCKLITAGSTLYLPVNVSGALFALGDLHAAMGDGEVSVCGLEISGLVETTLTVIKKHCISGIMLENEDHIYTICSAPTLDEAGHLATHNMVDFIVNQTALSLSETISLLSIVGNLEICQVVDPLKTCRFALPKSIGNQLGLEL